MCIRDSSGRRRRSLRLRPTGQALHLGWQRSRRLRLLGSGPRLVAARRQCHLRPRLRRPVPDGRDSGLPHRPHRRRPRLLGLQPDARVERLPHRHLRRWWPDRGGHRRCRPACLLYTSPSGRSPAISDAGRTCHGRRAAARRTRGAAGPQAGRRRRARRGCCEGASPTGAISAAPLAERGDPSTMAAMSLGESPARRAAAATDPADVPTRRSAAFGSQPIPSVSPARTPAWKARPASPPALRTTPIRATVVRVG